MEKGKVVEVNFRGIKCDACDFRDDTVRFEDYPAWLNRPCPKCGANLLTQADLDSVQRLVKTANFLNRIPILSWFSRGKKRRAATIEMNGTGRMVFKEKE